MPLRLLILISFLTAADIVAVDMYLPGMPAIAAEFGVSAARIQGTLSVFLVGLALGQGLYGPLLDRYGRRRPLLAGLFVFVAGSVVAALAPTVEGLLAGRLLQALGAAVGLVAPRAIVTDLCSVAQSARIFSLLMQIVMISPILAPVLGGYLVEHAGWRAIFWCLVAIGLAGLAWGAAALPETLPREKRAGAGLGGMAIAYAETARNPAFMLYVAAGGFVLGSLFAYISQSPFVFTGHFGLAPSQFSYVFAANAAGLIVGGQINDRLIRRPGAERGTMILGLAVHTLAALALFLSVRTGVATVWVYAVLLFVAIGALGLVFGNLAALSMAGAGARAGVASAIMGMLQYLFSAAIGYGAGLLPAGPGLLPMVMAVCGLLAALLAGPAARTGCPRRSEA